MGRYDTFANSVGNCSGFYSARFGGLGFYGLEFRHELLFSLLFSICAGKCIDVQAVAFRVQVLGFRALGLSSPLSR